MVVRTHVEKVKSKNCIINSENYVTGKNIICLI